MDPEESKRIIEKSGGDMAFARFLGIHNTTSAQQRVNNWKRRGIPSQILVTHWEKIQELRKTVGV